MRGPCIVYGCNKDGVHQLPKEETLKAQWITAAKLDTKLKAGRCIKTYTYFCSEHFQDNDFYYTQPLFAGDKGNKILKKGSVPSIFPWTLSQTREAEVAEVDATTSLSIEDSEDHDVRFDPSLVVNDYSKNNYPIRFVEEIPFIEVEPSDPTEDPLDLSNAEKHSETPTSDSFCLQLDNIDSDSVAMDVEVSGLEPSIGSCASPKREIKSYNDISVQTINNSPAFSVHTYKNDNKAIHFYTGLQSYKKMLFVFTSLGNDVHQLKYFYGSPPSSLDLLEQFFLTLIVLRRHKTFEELSMMYLISIKDVSNLVITWIRFMSLVWRNIDLWVGKETVKSYMPFDFNDKFPMTRVIIDATECPIKKPGLPRAQQITFSSYKNKNTVKFLLGITPSGLITYVSPCYGGSASDRQIIERSEILNRFDPNDEIMVDKGFNVQDIFISYGVKVNMPAFFKKGNQIGPAMLKRNRKVASKRIHVERAIGLLKTYRILIEPMNNTEIILSSDIVFICAMLTNFRTNIISKNA